MSKVFRESHVHQSSTALYLYSSRHILTMEFLWSPKTESAVSTSEGTAVKYYLNKAAVAAHIKIESARSPYGRFFKWIQERLLSGVRTVYSYLVIITYLLSWHYRQLWTCIPWPMVLMEFSISSIFVIDQVVKNKWCVVLRAEDQVRCVQAINASLVRGCRERGKGLS